MGLKFWQGRRNPSRKERSRRQFGPGEGPRLEILEVRELLSTLYVAPGGSGTGSVDEPLRLDPEGRHGRELGR